MLLITDTMMILVSVVVLLSASFYKVCSMQMRVLCSSAVSKKNEGMETNTVKVSIKSSFQSLPMRDTVEDAVSFFDDDEFLNGFIIITVVDYDNGDCSREEIKLVKEVLKRAGM